MENWELSRREFLTRSAYTAGLASVASTLPAGTIMAQAAQAAARRNQLPSPRNTPIDHFVILMMENRSFDHYFGWLSGEADAIQKQSFKAPDGTLVPTRHHSTLGTGGTEWKGCGHPDPGHGWDDGRAQLRGGFLDPKSGNDVFALTYYNEGELQAIHAAARNYTLLDHYHCSLLGPTWPNRYYKWSAQSGGKIDNNPPAATAGNQWETIFDRALSKGLSARYYASDLPFSVVWGARGATWTNPVNRFYSDCEAGTLPNISIVDPPFKDGGGGNGLSADEHPLGDVRLGQAFMADIVNAFVRSPNYKRGALFLIYDEWGGFFDHVRPPRVPDDRASKDPEQDFGQMGFRVPSVVVSPYARSKRKKKTTHVRVEHGKYGHESILKLISHRFGIGYLNKRHRYASNIGHAFDWGYPDFEVPQLPDPPEVATSACAVGGGDVADSQQAHARDLDALEELAFRHRAPVYEAAADQIFTRPDATRRAAHSRG